MPAITIGGLLAAVVAIVGTGVSLFLTVANLLANILFLPFKAFEGNALLITVFYWSILFVDVFMITQVTELILGIFGVHGLNLNFSWLFMLFVNLPLLYIFGFTIDAVWILVIFTFLLFAQFALLIRQNI